MMIENCDRCGVEVVFISYEGSPPEWDRCDECDSKLCPDCMGGHEVICKECVERKNNE